MYKLTLDLYAISFKGSAVRWVQRTEMNLLAPFSSDVDPSLALNELFYSAYHGGTFPDYPADFEWVPYARVTGPNLDLWLILDDDTGDRWYVVTANPAVEILG